MKNCLPVSIFLLLIQCSPALAEEHRIIGKWVVTDATCQACQKAGINEIGKLIHISNSEIIDPLSGNCLSNPSFDEMRLTSIDILKKNKLVRLSWIRSAGHKNFINMGFITCRGLDFVKIAVLDGRYMLYFYEETSVLLLEKMD